MPAARWDGRFGSAIVTSGAASAVSAFFSTLGALNPLAR
jgi:hypothetical protein